MRKKFDLTLFWKTRRLKIVWVLYFLGLFLSAIIAFIFGEYSAFVVVLVTFPFFIIFLQRFESILTALNIGVRELNREVTHTADLTEGLSKRVKVLLSELRSTNGAQASKRDDFEADLQERAVYLGDDRQDEILDILDFLVKVIEFGDDKNTSLPPAGQASIISILDQIKPLHIYVISDDHPYFLRDWEAKIVQVDEILAMAPQVPPGSVFILNLIDFEKIVRENQNWGDFLDAAFLVTGVNQSAVTSPLAGFEEVHPVAVSYDVRLYYPSERVYDGHLLGKREAN